MKQLLVILAMVVSTYGRAQDFYSDKQFLELLKIKNDTYAKNFEPYLIAHHGVSFDLDSFKLHSKLEYYKELWYYSKSFYVKRNVNPVGIHLDETIIDVSRFEHKRSETEEVLIVLDAFKDVLVLLPRTQLLFTND